MGPTTEHRSTAAPDRSTSGRPRWLAPLAVLAIAAVAIGLWLTQPWLLFVDVTADEQLPLTTTSRAQDTDPAALGDGDDSGGEGDRDADASVAVDGDTPAGDVADDADDGADGTAPVGTAPSPDDQAQSEAPAPVPVVLAEGSFISRDHGTSGTAAIVQLEDGSRVLTIEDLDTDNGPDLFVYLDDTPADGPEGDFDDGVSLGRLRANQGDLVYEIPDELDLTAITSVGIWCDRFSSLFGAADLLRIG